MQNQQNLKELKAQQKLEIKDLETKLILEVKNHCCIYVKNSQDYSNRRSRENAWEDIACVLGRRVDECQKKWNSLRDCFRSISREESNTPSGSASVQKPKWIHFESLKFLIPYIKVPGDDCGNYSMDPSMDLSIVFQDSEWGGEQDFGQEKETSTKKRKVDKAKKINRSNDEELEKVLKAIENTANPPSAPKKSMELFFESVAKQVEHFTTKKQLELQQKILYFLATDFADDI